MLAKRRKIIIVLLLLIIPFVCLCKSVHFRSRAMDPIEIMLVNLKNLNKRGKHEEMVREYEQLLKKYPEHRDVLYPLAWAYYKTGEYQKAEKYVDLYLHHNPYYPEYQNKYISLIKKAAENAL